MHIESEVEVEVASEVAVEVEVEVAVEVEVEVEGADAQRARVPEVSVAFKTSVTGQVLGVSGSTRGFIRHPSAASGAFILGLILAGIFMARSYGGFEPIAPRDMSSAHTARVYCRFVFGGLLVGFGTALGNGCTSGHGLTGLALGMPGGCFRRVGFAVLRLGGGADATFRRSVS